MIVPGILMLGGIGMVWEFAGTDVGMVFIGFCFILGALIIFAVRMLEKP